MTELEAVNILLSVIGEAPVVSLASEELNEVTDAALAQNVLNEVSRDVQSEGWSWNQSQNVEIPKTTSNTFVLPDTTLKGELFPGLDDENRFVIRGLKIYDRKDRTYEFPEKEDNFTLSLLTEQLEWEALPHTAKQYIVTRAARIYSNRFVNSSEIFGYTVQDEAYARAMMIRDEQGSSHDNMLWGNQRGTRHGIGYVPSDGVRHRRSFT